MATTTEKLQDPNLSEMEQDEIIGAFIQQQEDARLRKRWEKKLNKEFKLSKTPPPPKRSGASIRRIGIIVAAVAASLLLLVALLPQLFQQDGQELLAAYVEDVKPDGLRDVGESSADLIRKQFSDAFAGAQFAAAVNLAETVVALPAATDEDRLNLGEAYLRNQQYSQADAAFTQLINTDSPYLTEARFNLALSLLSQEKTAEGLAELQKISAEDGTRIYDEAQELLKAHWE